MPHTAWVSPLAFGLEKAQPRNNVQRYMMSSIQKPGCDVTTLGDILALFPNSMVSIMEFEGTA